MSEDERGDSEVGISNPFQERLAKTREIKQFANPKQQLVTLG